MKKLVSQTSIASTDDGLIEPLNQTSSTNTTKKEKEKYKYKLFF
jgi:hypothetical protein